MIRTATTTKELIIGIDGVLEHFIDFKSTILKRRLWALSPRGKCTVRSKTQ